MVPIEERQSLNYSTRKTPNDINLLVIHATVGGAAGSLNWLCNPKSGASAHYLISKKGVIYQLVPEIKKAWHAGKSSWEGRVDCNQYSIGIELENLNDGKDSYPVVLMQSCADLCKDIIGRYPKITLDRIVGHYMIAPGRKTDPAGFDWKWLLNLMGHTVLCGTGIGELHGKDPF